MVGSSQGAGAAEGFCGPVWIRYAGRSRRCSGERIKTHNSVRRYSRRQMNKTDEGLNRAITKWDLVALFVNVTVGAGILRLPADVQKAVGNYSPAAFVVCAVIIALIALCFAEVGSRFSGTGGPYLYARETFGPLPGFIVGWLMWLTRVAGFATLTQVFVAYLGYFWPAAQTGLPRITVITGLVVL